MKWTEEQRRVIETGDRNILVSAAAGSGKTAVLVQRILSMILRDDDPVDIDELLIVTFTKAAAGEMRERIAKALADAREQDPDNEHLARQTSLIHTAQITTIDGFCSYVIRSYGHTIGLVPGFRVVEEGEAALLLDDAMTDVLDRAYSEENEDRREAFHAFVETFASGKNEKDIETVIKQVFHAAVTNPYPEQWLEKCRKDYDISSLEEFMQSDGFRELERDAQDQFDLALVKAKSNLGYIDEHPELECYRTTAEEDLDRAAEAKAMACDFSKEQTYLQNLSFKTLPRAPKGTPKLLKDQFTAERKHLKDALTSLRDGFYSMESEAAFRIQNETKGPVLTLIDLAADLMETYDKAKHRKNLMDFSDLEHDALRILRGTDGKRTEAAKELSARFREVMIDEYQDSNYLQEAILTAVSKNEDEHPVQNYFCVGDVKQSIYSFRQARPELFMQKMRDYEGAPIDGESIEKMVEAEKNDASEEKHTAEEPNGEEAVHLNGLRIDLHKNFRSRQEVVDTVNGIFRRIMIPEVGGVRYDRDAELVKGADYADGGDFETEFLPVLTDSDEDDETFLDDVKADSARELEARAVGKRIEEMVGHFQVRDDETHEMRPAQYRDIVILLRTTRGWAEDFVRVLEDMRIPVYTESKTGYFKATEVETVLNYLRIVDNPQQDIPFTAVLTSPFAHISPEELAEIRTNRKAAAFSGSRRRSDISMYDAARGAAQDDSNPNLRDKLTRFFIFFDAIRESVPDTPLHELVYRVITESGFADYAAALPGGTQRTINLQMLVDKAISYESTSYVGLFNFVRYIEEMQDKDIDFGELSTIGEKEDVVRIYSIHKSKGLEYPIVFVAGLGKRFNTQDLRGKVLIHPEMGIATDYVNYKERYRMETVRKMAVRERKRKDMIGEEIRVLYVALTRAKQKLILTGSVKDEKTLEGMKLDMSGMEHLPVSVITGAPNMLTWLVPAVDDMVRKAEIGREPNCISRGRVTAQDLAAHAVGEEIRRAVPVDQLRQLKRNELYDPKMRSLIEERFSYRYPYAGRESIPVEVSVSELKTMRMQDPDADYPEEEEALHIYGNLQDNVAVSGKSKDTACESNEVNEEKAGQKIPEDEGLIPEFIRKEWKEEAGKEGAGEAANTKNVSDSESQVRPLRGAARGTAYHHVMQLLDFSACVGKSEKALYAIVKTQMESVLESGKLTKEEVATVRAWDVVTFLKSDLGQRTAEADARGDLFREQPFVIGVPASEIREDWPDDEMIYVQGMIDAFFFEGEDVVLIDYKTDYVEKAEELTERYQIQIDEYAEALRKVTGKAVKERHLWSFRLGEAIRD